MVIKYAIFDFDGTLADTFGLFIEILNKLAPIYRYNSVEVDEIEKLKFLSFSDVLSYLSLRQYKVPFLLRSFRKEMNKKIEHVKLFEGVVKMLNVLEKEDIQIIILSSNSEENIKTVMQDHGIDFIAHYECGISMLGKKSKLLKIKKMMQAKDSFKDEKFLYIGDEIRDIEASKSAEMSCVAVAWGYNSKESLLEHSPTKLCETMNMLESFILE